MIIKAIIDRFKAEKFRKNAIKNLWLIEDESTKRKSVKYDEIYVVMPDFYEKHVKGKEKKVTRLLNYRSIAVLYNAKAEDKISFVHNTNFNSAVVAIELEGINCTEQYPLPLGSGIYVWSIDKPNKSWICGVTKSFKISNYEGQYLQLVYYEDSRYDSPETTEYLLLKICQKNVIKM